MNQSICTNTQRAARTLRTTLPALPAGLPFSVTAPCKINLHLLVGKKRDDDFHGLESIVAALDFADTLTFSVLPGNGAETSLVVEDAGPLKELALKGQIFPPIQTEKNLVYRAVELFRSKTGFSANLAIKLIKRIPPGSGLGGGSSDAAATLLALNDLAGRNCPAELDRPDQRTKLSGEALLDLAAQLGSDIPFFIGVALGSTGKTPAWAVSGRGEVLQPLPPPPPLGVLLAFPGFASYTGAAYSLMDEARPFTEKRIEKAGMNGSWPPPENWDFTNDFLDLFLSHGTGQEKSSYRTVLESLKNAGAAFTGLSGSGSACFGIFSCPGEAEAAKKKLAGSFYTLQNTFFLA